MRRRYAGTAKFVVLCMLLFYVLCLPVAGNYVVVPAYNITPPSPVDTSIHISFWDLPPRAMLIHLVLFISPVLVFPIELFFLVKIFAYLGYRKIAKTAVFNNRNRERIYRAIQEKPGRNLTSLTQATGINESTLKYHLVVLSLKNKISSFQCIDSVRYFENKGQYTDFEKRILGQFSGGTDATILDILFVSPGLTQKEIAEKIGISPASVSWHMHRLDHEGIVVSEKKGKYVRFSLTESALRVLRRSLGAPDGPVR